MRFPVFTHGRNRPFSLHPRPFNSIHSDASWGGRILFEDTRFFNFPMNSHSCGGRLSIMESHPDASDYTPEVKLVDTVFKSVSFTTAVWFYLAKPEWGVVERCGEFTCTGPNNYIVTFDQVDFADFGSEMMW